MIDRHRSTVVATRLGLENLLQIPFTAAGNRPIHFPKIDESGVQDHLGGVLR